MRSHRSLVLAVPLLGVPLLVAAGRAETPLPAVEGPIAGPGTAFVQATSFDLADVGYVQEEYFIAGTARAWTSAGPLGDDGRWAVTAGETAPFRTRLVVHRPIDRKAFTGTVVVEWLNVSGGLDAAPDWTMAHTAFVRQGWAWVGVSAQVVGVEGGSALVGVVSLPLKAVNPERYGRLQHPGDSFSYDIFSQAGQAIRAATGPRPLGDLTVRRLLAAGESQSAFRLVTYVNAIHPVARVYDGYFIHSRGGLALAGLSEPPQPAIPVPGAAPIRDDIDVPVLIFQTETDLTFLASVAARQPDAGNVRLWEVAGTAHADAYTLVVGPGDRGDSPAVAGLVVTAAPIPGLIECARPINAGPQHLVGKAAFVALERWVRRRKPPRAAPRLEVTPGPPPAIVVDEHGNARGGIRTPAVDVPIATFTGEQDGSILCRLFGSTTPFDEAKLRSLYPTRGAFVRKYRRALARAVRAGWILRPDAKLMRAWAAGASIGG